MLARIKELQVSNEATGSKLEKAQSGTTEQVVDVQKQVQASGDAMADATEGVNMSVQQSTAQLEFVSQAVAQGNALAEQAIQSNTGMLTQVRMAVDGVARQFGQSVGPARVAEDTRNYLAYLVLLENFDVKLSDAVNALVEHLGGGLESVTTELKTGLECIRDTVDGLVVTLDKTAKVSQETGDQNEQISKANIRTQTRTQDALSTNTRSVGSLGLAVSDNTQRIAENTQALTKSVAPALGLMARSQEQGTNVLEQLIDRLAKTGYTGGLSEAQMSNEQIALRRSIDNLARQLGATAKYNNLGGGTYEGPAGVTGGPFAGSSVNMNFYGVTNPTQMADKIISSLRLRGVDI